MRVRIGIVAMILVAPLWCPHVVLAQGTGECGDGIVQLDEECDDGNTIDDDGCDSFCETTCGDGIVVGDEQCDDGNTDEDDGCDSFCETTCGDGIRAGSEECDDGNAVEGDGCNSECQGCPSVLCECLGGARLFTAVAGGRMAARTGKLTYFGDAEYIESVVGGSLCAASGKFSAKELPNEIDGDAIFAAAASVAARFATLRFFGTSEPSTYIGGVLATGGGTLTGVPAGVDALGGVSTDGTYVGLPACRTAAADLTVASQRLRDLPATRTIEEIVVTDGEVYELNVGPGNQVINVGTIKLRSVRDFGLAVPSELAINFDIDTQSVVINVSKELKIEADGVISINGADDAVILNLHSAKPRLALKRGVQIAPVLLVPHKDVKAPVASSLANTYTAGKMSLAGAWIDDILLCE